MSSTSYQGSHVDSIDANQRSFFHDIFCSIIFGGKPRNGSSSTWTVSMIWWTYVNLPHWQMYQVDDCWCWGIHLSLEGSLLYLYHLLQRLSQAFSGGSLKQCSALWRVEPSCHVVSSPCVSLTYFNDSRWFRGLNLKRGRKKRKLYPKPQEYEYIQYSLLALKWNHFDDHSLQMNDFDPSTRIFWKWPYR